MTEHALPARRGWSDRWAWRGAIIGAPLGALAAVLHALLAMGASPVRALVLYAIGAVAASGVGCLLGGPLGGAVDGFRAWRRRSAPAVLATVDQPDEGLDVVLEPQPAHAAHAA